MLTVWTATQVCEHQPTPRACLLVPKEMLGVSVTRPGTGLAAPWLSLWVSWAVSVQQGTREGFFLTWKEIHSLQVTSLCQVGSAQGLGLQADASVLQIPPETSLLCSPGSTRPVFGRWHSVLTRSFLSCTLLR